MAAELDLSVYATEQLRHKSSIAAADLYLGTLQDQIEAQVAQYHVHQRKKEQYACASTFRQYLPLFAYKRAPLHCKILRRHR